MKANVKKGDVVMVISGSQKQRDKTATVVGVDLKNQRVMLEGDGAKLIRKSVKPRRATERGGIQEKYGTIHISNVMPICAACNKPTRIGHKFEEADGKTVKHRICKKCGVVLVTPKVAKSNKDKDVDKPKTKRKVSRKADKNIEE